MSLFDTIKALLPNGAAWRIVVDKMLRRFFEGLAESPEEIKDYADEILLDAFPSTTRQLTEWERQFGIRANGNTAERRRAVDVAWKASGGQSPRYIQDLLQAAGFDLYVHEWWWDVPIIESELVGVGTLPPTVTVSGDYELLTGLRVRILQWWGFADPLGPLLEIQTSLDGGDTWDAPIQHTDPATTPWTVEIPGAPGAFLTFPRNVEYYTDTVYEPALVPEVPRVVREPLRYASQPLMGIFQCGDHPTQPQAYDGPEAPYCNDFLANDPGYIVNLDLTRRAPPPIPEDPDAWRYFFYIGGETFPERVEIPSERRAELEWLVQKLKPAQNWVVMLVDYVGSDVVVDDSSDEVVVEDGTDDVVVHL